MTTSNFTKFFNKFENNDFESYIDGNEGIYAVPFSELKINKTKSVCCDVLDYNKVDVWVVDYAKDGETLDSMTFDYTSIKEVYERTKEFALNMEKKWA